MKILAIRLKNLASLAGPFEIDFTAEPLASAGLFAITGPTGAGKSTLLDALCLALFGAVPRLNNIGRETKVPEVDSEILTSDPRTLLRRGSGSGYAEVDFVGIDGRRYRARWEANRARDKANGKLQASRQNLTDLDSEQLLSNQSKSEYKQLIEARLGLNFEQFTRAVMLAQSEFSAFLKADDKERSELLEKLTNTSIYSQLGRRAYSKSKEAEEVHKELKAQASGITPLDPEARAELDQQFDAARQQLKEQQARLKQLEAQHSWLKELGQWQQARQDAAEQLQQAEQQALALAPERLRLQRLEQLAPQRHQFLRQIELHQALEPLGQQIEQQAAQQVELQQRHQQLQQHVLDADSALTMAQSQHSDSAPLLREAFAEQANLSRLGQSLSEAGETRDRAQSVSAQGQQSIAELLEKQRLVGERLERIAGQLAHSAALAPLSEAWTLYRERLQQLMLIGNRLNQGQAELPALEQRAGTAAQQLAEQRSHLELLYSEAGAEPQAVAEQIQLLDGLLKDNRKQQRATEELARLWAQQQELDQRGRALQDKQQAVAAQREALNQAGLQAKAELSVAEQTLSVTQALLERQRLARSASVEELRGQLQDDQPCPVCGSVEHPYHQPEALLQSLGRHDESEEANARQAVDRLKEQLNELRAQVQGLIAQQKEFLQQQEQLASQQQALAPSLQAHPQSASLLDQDPARRDAWLRQQLEQLQQSITQDESRLDALLTLQKDATRLQQQLQQAQDASQQAAQHLHKQQEQLAADQQRLEEELASFNNLLPAEVLEGLRRDPASTFMQLDQQVLQRIEQLRERQDEAEEQQQRQLLLDKEQDRQLTRQQQLSDAQQQLDALSQQHQACQDRLAALLGSHPSAELWQQQLDQAVEQARSAQAKAQHEQQELQQQLIQLSAELKARQERLQALDSERQQLAGSIEQWRAQHPELDDSGLQQLLELDEEQVQQLRQQLQANDKAIEQAKVLLQERQQRLQQHQAQHNGNLEAGQLAQALEELQQQALASEQQVAELRARQSEDQRRQEANQALGQQIHDAYQQWQRWARLNALIGSATGDTFRKIAQAYNLDLLVHHANAQLRQLVRRYRLKRGGSMLGLLVLDTEMGDELRSVHSLSGGETFLVSLALALGRKVAVISHVQEMHERIPVQIQVSRQGNGLSTLEVK
ncbi:chromosome segregation protein SMC [Pseudomonas protegens]|uniref:Chromosome segregation protein SMC n=1 Tax=Pseudomonas protegens TaxID=380021 RepID=A0A2T6GFV8_9PSED|nr:AAA family ATPase [Pseudomonas protegens]PUA43031.1 chromosome segregation protein SMC [Pseudomonas protegens]